MKHFTKRAGSPPDEVPQVRLRRGGDYLDSPRHIADDRLVSSRASMVSIAPSSCHAAVPTAMSVLNSSQQAVTVVTQDQFVPFEGDGFRLRIFRLHTLPWQREALEDLGSADVRLRITLSYFIEPSASRRGRRQRYAYASHSLRFDLQGQLETRQEFVARINRDAQIQEDGSSSGGTTSEQ